MRNPDIRIHTVLFIYCTVKIEKACHSIDRKWSNKRSGNRHAKNMVTNFGIMLTMDQASEILAIEVFWDEEQVHRMLTVVTRHHGFCRRLKYLVGVNAKAATLNATLMQLLVIFCV